MQQFNVSILRCTLSTANVSSTRCDHCRT